MKKTTRFIIIFLSLYAYAFTSSAQLHSIGLAGGYANTTVNLEDAITNEANSESNFLFGVQVDFKLTQNWFLGLDLLYQKRGYRDPLFSVREFDFNYTYIAAPFRVSYRVGDKVQGFVSAGFTQAFLLEANAVGPLIGPADELIDPAATFDLKEFTKNYDLAGMIGVGGRLNLRKLSLSLEGRYNQSFTNLEKESRSRLKAFHQSWQMLLGVHYLLGNK